MNHGVIVCPFAGPRWDCSPPLQSLTLLQPARPAASMMTDPGMTWCSESLIESRCRKRGNLAPETGSFLEVKMFGPVDWGHRSWAGCTTTLSMEHTPLGPPIYVSFHGSCEYGCEVTAPQMTESHGVTHTHTGLLREQRKSAKDTSMLGMLGSKAKAQRMHSKIKSQREPAKLGLGGGRRSTQCLT